jgi:ABC-type polysaccharide/polyol phosphate transport system ATPase subunit
MIELGVGFSPDLTGRENLYLNTSLFGLSRREADTMYESIVRFSELEEFVDLPVKNYSTGMYMRLGFAIAIHLEADVYLVDEVLSVGDLEFQGKCLEKVRELRSRGATIVLVSHDLSLVERLCDRAYLLASGHVRAHGETRTVLEAYRGLTP